MSQWIQLGFDLGLPVFLLIVAYGFGHAIERRHFRSVRRRETASIAYPIMNLRDAPESWHVEEAGLVTGSVVISIDYFKRFLSVLRGIFGGRIKSYESLLDRARREAILRMKENALDTGYSGVINVRLQSSRLASSSRDGKGTTGIEMIAYGTGVRRQR